jgi:signal-transduction protein with cAMP-binding, CBS, and nucleotidyltransferase domain
MIGAVADAPPPAGRRPWPHENATSGGIMSIGQGQGLFGATLAAEMRGRPVSTPALGSEWLTVLETVPLFAGLSKRHLRRVARMAIRADVSKHTVIVGPERDADSFFVVLDGEAEVATPTGTHIRLGPGRFFGEMALLDSSPRTATVTAATDMQVMRISQSQFSQLLEAEPKVGLAIMRELAARVRRLEGETHQ